MSLNLIELIAPSAWASYLINGDASGLDAGEKAQCDRWLRRLRLSRDSFLSCEDYGFTHVHDAREYAGAADCQTYIVNDTSI